MDYSKGKIYKIIDKSNGDLYIGSTIQPLRERYYDHNIFDNYGKKKDNCEMILIEDYPCESKRKLEEREQYHIDINDCINKQRAYTSRDESRKRDNNTNRIYYENNKYEINIKRNKYGKIFKSYQKSWGGDMRSPNNNLLKIDPTLFT